MLPCDEGSATMAVRPLGFRLPDNAADVQPGTNLKSEASAVAAAPDIQTLTHAVRRGDADAFSRFYDLYSFRLYKYLLVLALFSSSWPSELMLSTTSAGCGPGYACWRRTRLLTSAAAGSA